MGQSIIIVSLFQPSVICILGKQRLAKQKNNNLRKKIVENNNIHELWHLFFMVINLHMHFHKSFIGLGSHPRIVAYKRKLFLVKDIYKKTTNKKRM
jgi:hypothetical protein